MELSTFNPVREEVDATAATTGFKGTDITSDDTAHQDFRFRVGLNSTAVPETLYGHNRSVGAVAMAAATLDQHTDSAVHKEYLGVNHDEPSALTSRSGTVWVCTGSSDNTIKVGVLCSIVKDCYMCHRAGSCSQSFTIIHAKLCYNIIIYIKID